MKNDLIKFLASSNWLVNTAIGLSTKSHRILSYHLVSEKVPKYYYKDSAISPGMFKTQMKWLVSHGYKYIPLDIAFKSIESGENLRKTFSITTDDGFSENYSYLADILHDLNLGCTMFLINNCIDNRDLMWSNKVCYIRNMISRGKEIQIIKEISLKYNLASNHNNLKSFSKLWNMNIKDEIANECWKRAEIGSLQEFLISNKPYLSSIQIKEMLNAGFSIGSHSYSHPNFSKLEEDELQKELIFSKIDLEDRFNQEIMFFAYPYGVRPNKEIEEKYKNKSGFKLLFGIKNNLSNYSKSFLWERDKMEFNNLNKSIFWFSYIPLLRKWIIKPLGLYK